MTRAFLLCMLLIAVAKIASAQTVSIRSGEHETFSRLVMHLDRGSDWSIDRSDRKAQVTVARSDIVFDTKKVFDRIPRTRLLELSQDGAGDPLELTLNCNCDVEGFIHSDTFLVVDIRDSTTTDVAQHPVLPPLPHTSYKFDLGKPHAQPSPLLGTSLSRATPAVPPDPRSPDVANRPPPAIQHRLSEQRLLAQIERAASQGLLTPATQLAPPTALPDRSAANPSHLSDEHSAPAINTVSATVIDRDMSGIAGELRQISGAHECPLPEVVALGEWGNDQPFSDQIGQLRAELFQEFDRLNTDAAMTLAKSYLHFGFGSEAQAVLSLIPEQTQDVGILLTLADILDDHQSMKDNNLAGRWHCSGDLPLWSILAEPDKARDVDTDMVTQSFSRLPLHLRQQIGPRLGRLFNDAGQHDVAAAILRAIDHSSDVSGPAQNLVSAEIEEATGDTEIAAETMTKVVDGGSEYSPEALAQLIEVHWSDQLPLRPDLPDLAGAYAAEYRLTELGSTLRRSHATALALTARFEEVPPILDDIYEQDGAEALNEATVPFLSQLTENANDVTFLSFALLQTESDDMALPAALEVRMAERLYNLGFAEQAFSVLDRAKTGSRPESVRLLRAKVALATGLPHRAMIEVLNLSGPEVSQIRARAMLQNGDFERAGQSLLASESPEGAARNLWLGGAWDQVASAEDPQYRRLAELSAELAQQVTPEDALPPLAGARSLLEDSSNVRAGIGEMLTALQIDQEDD